MADITPVSSQPTSGVAVYLWETFTESDTALHVAPSGYSSVVGAVQAVGTFGGATVVLQGSNDGTNWVDLNDSTGSAISLTAAGGAEFSTGFAYIRPSASGGTSQDVDIYLSLRG